MVVGKDSLSRKTDNGLQYGSVVTSSGRVSAVRNDAYVPDTPPFSPNELISLDEALTKGTRKGRACFSTFIGDLGSDAKIGAEKIFYNCPEPSKAVLIAVDPNNKKIVVVYGAQVAGRVTEPVAKLGVSAVKSGIKRNDLIGGLVSAIEVIANSI